MTAADTGPETGPGSGSGSNSAPATPLSINEVRFIFTRAAVGVGAPYGIGEELTAAALWLAALGADPAKVAARALDGLADGSSDPCADMAGEPPVLSPSGTRALSAIYAGPAAADRLNAGAAQVALRHVDCPALATAIVAATCPAAPLRFEWCGTDGAVRVLTCSGDVATLSGCNVETLAETQVETLAGAGGCDLIIGRADVPGPGISLVDGRAATVRRGVPVGAVGWACVSGHFRKCLVPSTAESRASGAGAGLTDND